VMGDAQQRALGWGLRCDPIVDGDHGRDLALAPGPNGLDLARISGADNLNQCLTIALTTALGDDVFNTDFGFDGLRALAEETVPSPVRERVRASIIRLLKRDPRVRDIVDLKVLDRRLDPTPPDDQAGDPDVWRALRVNVVFQTVTGEPTAISLAIGAADV